MPLRTIVVKVVAAAKLASVEASTAPAHVDLLAVILSRPASPLRELSLFLPEPPEPPEPEIPDVETKTDTGVEEPPPEN